jgi:hypothetical protein
MAKEDGYSLEVIAPVDSMLLLDKYNTTREYLIHGELIVPGQDMYLGAYVIGVVGREKHWKNLCR